VEHEVKNDKISETMAKLYNLSHRSNINVYNYPECYGREEDDRRIILYDDHRTILDVLYYAIQEGYFDGQTPNVVSFDYHDDSVKLSSKVKQRANTIRKRCAAKRQDKLIWQFVEFELSSLDDDWVRAGMELGLIKNYIGFGHHCIFTDAGNIDNGFEHYTTLDKEVHRLYSNGHLDFVLGDRGVIGDDCYEWQQKHNDIKDDLQYHSGHFDRGEIRPFILDIDLDCFSTECEEHTMAWPEAIFVERYVENVKVSSFMHYLLDRASFITICREPGYCGGVGEANRILEILDCYWLGGTLKTRRIE